MRDSYVDPAPRVGLDPPKRSRREVAEHRPRTRGQDRRKPAALATDRLVSNCIDTRMQPMQVPNSNSSFNRFFSEPQPHQLPPPHHPMLSPRDRGNVPVIRASPRKPFLETG